MIDNKSRNPQPPRNLRDLAFQAALDAAKVASTAGEVPIGAALYWPMFPGRGIISAGNARERQHDPTAHAEVEVLRMAAKSIASWRLEGAHMIVTLEPCPMCLGAIQQARVKRVEFAAWDTKGGALSLGMRHFEDPRATHRFEVCPELRSEAQFLLRTFFESLRSRF